MSLLRWQRPVMNALSPFEHLALLSGEIDRLFDTTSVDEAMGMQLPSNGRVPSIDLFENDGGFVLTVQVPGLKKEDIHVSLRGDVLTVSGERKEDEVFSKAATHRAERFFGEFQRTLTLPRKVDPAKVHASYEDGVLTVRLGKADEAKPKHIEISVN